MAARKLQKKEGQIALLSGPTVHLLYCASDLLHSGFTPQAVLTRTVLEETVKFYPHTGPQ